MKALIENGIVTGFATGDVPGLEIPEQFCDLDALEMRARLRVVDGKIVDASKEDVFFVDEAGTKFLEAGEDRTKIEARFDTPLVREGDTWRARTDEDDRADKRRELVRVVEAARVSLEAQAITVGGVEIPTDTDTLARLNTERVAVFTGDRENGEDFVINGVPTSLTNDEVSEAWRTVRDRSKALASKAAEVLEKIEAGKITNAAQIRKAMGSVA
jgi:hypothetical protein